jgi:hypothetical protein
VDLSGTLPDCPLEVTAARLSGNSGAAEDQVWEQFSRHLSEDQRERPKPLQTG